MINNRRQEGAERLDLVLNLNFKSALRRKLTERQYLISPTVRWVGVYLDKAQIDLATYMKCKTASSSAVEIQFIFQVLKPAVF